MSLLIYMKNTLCPNILKWESPPEPDSPHTINQKDSRGQWGGLDGTWMQHRYGQNWMDHFTEKWPR